MELEEIEEFRTPGEFERFKAFLNDGVTRGDLIKVTPDQSYHEGEIYGGEWFELCQDKSVWRLISPDPPFYGLFERVKNKSK